MGQAEAYPLFEISGSSFEVGRQHGEACRDQIRTFLEYSYKTIGDAKNQDPATLRARAESFVPSIRGFIPDAIEEMEGIAEGANVAFAEVVLLNVRTELTLGNAGLTDGCSSLGFLTSHTDNESTIIAQNQDVGDWMKDVGVVLRAAPEEKPAFIMFTWAGVIGYPGFNEHGVAFVQNQLYTEGLAGWGLALPSQAAHPRVPQSRGSS